MYLPARRAVGHLLYTIENEYDLMQNEDNDAGGPAPVKEADEVML